MIYTELQYRNTQRWILRFEKAVAELKVNPPKNDRIDAIMRKAEIDAIQAKIWDLKKEVDDYEQRQAKRPKHDE